MKKIYITMSMLASITIAMAQNWANVGSPSFTNGSTSSSFLYFGDMEIDASGNVYVGYWDYGGKMNVAKNSGTSWTILPSPGIGAVSVDDIEIFGSDVYYSYMGARGTNYYAFVKKYNGSSSWSFIGDSVLIGGTGQGGSFDFLLDNAGIPTLIGLPKAAFGDKTVKQFVSGAWKTTCVIPKTTSAIFKDNSAVFDANNNLNCIAGGALTLSGPPYIKYYVVGLKIADSITTVFGDTIYCSSTNSTIRLDNTGTSYLLFNDLSRTAFLTYKLNTNKWDMISDTVASVGNMIYSDVSSDGKVAFCVQSFTQFHKSLYLYNGNKRTRMDTINFSGVIIAGISDIVIRNSEVYVLYNEGGYSVMKHSLNGSSSGLTLSKETQANVQIYPNPSRGNITIDANQNIEKGSVKIYNLNGVEVYQLGLLNQSKIDIKASLPSGIYLLELTGVNGIYKRVKISVE